MSGEEYPKVDYVSDASTVPVRDLASEFDEMARDFRKQVARLDEKMAGFDKWQADMREWGNRQARRIDSLEKRLPWWRFW